MKYQYEVQIGALLHDIGKFYQKSGLNASSKNNIIDGVKIAGSHAEVGKRFIERYKVLFENAQLDVEALSEIVLRHHSNPNWAGENIPKKALRDLAPYCNMVNYGDNLSSSSREEKEVGNQYKPLKSVYGSLKDKNILFRMSTESIDSYEANNEEERKKLDSDEDRKLLAFKMINDFSKEMSKLIDMQITDPIELYNKLYTILEIYTRFVNPATNAKDSDESLFDHLSTTSAISGCIYKNLYTKYGDTVTFKNSENIGNIYITHFSIINNSYLEKNKSGKDTLKIFSGRSKNIRDIKNNIVSHILAMTNLSISNIIAESELESYILVPECDLDAIKKYLKEENKRLFSTYNSELYIDFKICNYAFNRSMYDNIEKSERYMGLNDIFISKEWNFDTFKVDYNITNKIKKCLYCGHLTEKEVCDNCNKALKNKVDTQNDKFSIILFKDNEYDASMKNGFKSDDKDKSSLSRIATYLRLSSDFFSNEITKLTSKYTDSLSLISSINSCYIICNVKDTYKIVDDVLAAYKKYTCNTFNLVASIKEYKNSDRFIDFTHDCNKLNDSLYSKNKEANIGNLLVSHESGAASVKGYINLINKVQNIYNNSGVSRSLLYRVEQYLDSMIKYSKTKDAQYLTVLPILNRELTRRYGESEQEFIKELILEAKRAISADNFGKIKIYKEALSRVIRS